MDCNSFYFTFIVSHVAGPCHHTWQAKKLLPCCMYSMLGTQKTMVPLMIYYILLTHLEVMIHYEMSTVNEKIDPIRKLSHSHIICLLKQRVSVSL